MRETSAQLLRRAALNPATLKPTDRLALGPDLEIAADSIAFVLRRMRATIARLDTLHRTGKRQAPPPAIHPTRWKQILDQVRAGTWRPSQMPPDEIRAIDCDAQLSRELAVAMEEWAS